MEFKKFAEYTSNANFYTPCGTLFSFSRSSEPQIIKSSNEDIDSYRSVGGELSSTQCFDSFWGRYQDTGLFYFSFPAVPIWYNKVIDEFNSTFDYMKITSVFEKDIFLYEESGMGSSVYKFRFSSRGNGDQPSAKKVVFCLKLDSNFYKPFHTRQRVSYLIHHFFRMLSYSEKYYITFLDEDPGENYVEFVLNLSNRIVNNKDSIIKNYHDMTYRSLAETTISKEEFLNLNKEVINEAYGKDQSNRHKQTSLITTLKQTNLLNWKGKYFTLDKNQTFLMDLNKIKGIKTSVIRIDNISLITNIFTYSIFLIPDGTRSFEINLSNLNLLTDEITKEEAEKLVTEQRNNFFSMNGKYFSGVELSNYYYTNNDSLLREVKTIDSARVEVEIVDHKRYTDSIGMTYVVRKDRLEEVKIDDWKNSKIKKTIGKI